MKTSKTVHTSSQFAITSLVSFVILLILIHINSNLFIIFTLLVVALLCGLISAILAIMALGRGATIKRIGATMVPIALATLVTFYLIVRIIFLILAFNICSIECSTEDSNNWIVRTDDWLNGQ